MTRKGPLAINYEALWQEGMKDWHGNMPERMVNDQLEEQFWAQSVARKKRGKQILMLHVFSGSFRKALNHSILC